MAAVRRWLYRCGLCKAYQAPIPTIGVGNLSVGGTGKTPHVELLIRLLSEKYKIATLSRGYKRKTKGFVLANDIALQELSAEMVGDEPLQFFSKFPHIKVAVDEKSLSGECELRQAQRVGTIGRSLARRDELVRRGDRIVDLGNDLEY